MTYANAWCSADLCAALPQANWELPAKLLVHYTRHDGEECN